MYLHISDLHKSFGSTRVLHGLNFDLAGSETLSILGRSGGGKTTLLKLIAGLLRADGGSIRLNGQDIGGLPPQRRNIVYLYQESLLFPHLNVFDNIAFGLQLRRLPAPDVRRRVEAMLDRLDLPALAQRRPHQLSGGQRQRVAFGRALIVQPKVLLLDEPFGNLDVETRQQMQRFFKDVAVEMGITALFVTHDVKEAILMGDRLGFLEAGKLTVYPDLAAFLQDERTGAAREAGFWKGLQI